MTEQERKQYTDRYSGTYFRHQDGGIYQFTGFARSSDSLAYSVVYTHIWPFTKETWIRPLTEWTLDRFAPITVEYAISALTGDRTAGQAQVTEAKSIRQAKKRQDMADEM